MALLTRTKRASRVFATLALALLTSVSSTSFGEAFNEYQVKAIFLLRFAQFVDWPQSASASPGRPFVIGVLGADPFDGFLDETVRGEALGARPVVVKRFHTIQDVTDCEILFVSDSESREVGAIIDALGKRPVLTVSDADGFAKHGGMVEFITERKRVKFAINVDAAHEANLTLSSKLLRPAIIVSSRGG